MIHSQSDTLKTPDEILELIKRFKEDNPKEDPLYTINDIDYENQKSLLDELERREDVTITQVSEKRIEVKLANKESEA